MGIGGRFELTTIGPDRVDVGGSFATNGTSSPSSSSNKGKGWSVARTSVGLYTVTFDESWPELDAILAQVQGADGDGYDVEVGDYDSSAKTVQLRVFDRRSAGSYPLDITALREISSNDIQNLAAHGGIMASDSTPALVRVNGATDKALVVRWASSDSTEVQFPPVPMLPGMNGSNDISVHLLAKMGGATDTPTIDIQAFDGIGDTEMGGATAALSDTLAEVTATIANANIAGHPTGFLNIALVPGAHTTDALDLYAAWIEYKTLVDLAADSNSRIHLIARFRNTSIPY